MARTSSKIKVITGRDSSLMKQLCKTGISTSFQAKEYCGLSKERLAKLEKSGYIKTSERVIRGESNLVIQLDKVGKEHCRQEYGVTSFASAQTNHLEHDVKLTEFYYKLDESVQETWRHERELIQEYYYRNPEVAPGSLKTCIDASIEVNGEIIAIESIGDSYTAAEIELKEQISIDLGCSSIEFF